MDARAMKLMRRYKISVGQAQALVEAGYGLPHDIAKATDAQLRAVKGIGEAAIRKLRR